MSFCEIKRDAALIIAEATEDKLELEKLDLNGMALLYIDAMLIIRSLQPKNSLVSSSPCIKLPSVALLPSSNLLLFHLSFSLVTDFPCLLFFCPWDPLSILAFLHSRPVPSSSQGAQTSNGPPCHAGAIKMQSSPNDACHGPRNSFLVSEVGWQTSFFSMRR